MTALAENRPVRRLRAVSWAETSPMREHLAALRQAGATWEAISAASGTSLDDIWAVNNDFGGITEATATRLMAVTVDDLKGYRWDATGTRWRLRSLAAMGHSTARMARALGSHPETVRKAITDGEAVSFDFRRQVMQLWDAWWDKTPPERNKGQRAHATRTRNRAAREGWCCPLALDEECMDTPGYKPLSAWLPVIGCGVAGDYPLGQYRVIWATL